MSEKQTLNDFLIFSCRSGNMDLISERLEKGADINHQNSSGHTPLLTAIKNGSIPVVKYLLEYGADPSLKDNYGNNALEYAIEFRNEEIADILLNSGAWLGDKASPSAKQWLIMYKKGRAIVMKHNKSN